MDDFKSKRCLSGLIWMLTTKTEEREEREEKSAVRAEPQRHERGSRQKKTVKYPSLLDFSFAILL